MEHRVAAGRFAETGARGAVGLLVQSLQLSGRKAAQRLQLAKHIMPMPDSITAEVAPAALPVLGQAFLAGKLSPERALSAARFLEDAQRLRSNGSINPETLADVEESLTATAVEQGPDFVRAVGNQIMSHIDPDASTSNTENNGTTMPETAEANESGLGRGWVDPAAGNSGLWEPKRTGDFNIWAQPPASKSAQLPEPASRQPANEPGNGFGAGWAGGPLGSPMPQEPETGAPWPPVGGRRLDSRPWRRKGDGRIGLQRSRQQRSCHKRHPYARPENVGRAH